MRAYAMKGINKEGGDYFQVAVPGAPVTTDRWVHTDCGLHVVDAGTSTATASGEDTAVVTPPSGAESDDHLLALSWQPAFCETRPDNTECRHVNDGLLPITETQLSLHGLWPQPRGKEYCGVPRSLVDTDRAGRWSDLPEPELDPEIREALEVAMPGSASYLHRHEWIRHGTCHMAEGGANEYYRDTLRLVDAINASEVGQLLAANVGSEIDTRSVRAAFDTAFGPGAGERVQIQCTGDGDRVLVQEIKIGLRGVIAEDTGISDLLLAAEPVAIGCRAGIIDPAGRQ
jgi:ribonuclease T2